MMKSLKEVLDDRTEVTNWTGSEKTAAAVADEVRLRYGESELANFDPARSMRTFRSWLQLGFVPQKGERAIKSYAVVEVKDEKSGKVVKRFCRKINLFYYRQVVELDSKKV